MIFVTCKNEECGAKVPAPEANQLPMDQLEKALHKKNYYLCPTCGKVLPYTLEDHQSE